MAGSQDPAVCVLGDVKTDREPAGKFLLPDPDFGKPTLSKSPTLERLTASRQT